MAFKPTKKEQILQMLEFACAPRSPLAIFLGWSRSGCRTEHECHNLHRLRNILAEARLPPSTSIPPIPLLPTNPPWFWPYFPLCCLYLALRWPGQWPLPVVPARSVHLSVDDRAPATSSTSPDTSPAFPLTSPGLVASQPSWGVPTGGLLLLIGHRSPLGSLPLPWYY